VIKKLLQEIIDPHVLSEDKHWQVFCSWLLIGAFNSLTALLTPHLLSGQISAKVNLSYHGLLQEAYTDTVPFRPLGTGLILIGVLSAHRKTNPVILQKVLAGNAEDL
jgi:hypothetical protein